MRYSGKEQQKPVLLLLLKTVIVLVGGILVGFLLNYYVTSEIAAIYYPDSDGAFYALWFGCTVGAMTLLYLILFNGIEAHVFLILEITYFFLLVMILFGRDSLEHVFIFNPLRSMRDLTQPEMIFQSAANVLLFIPMGYFMRNREFGSMLKRGLLLSLSIELIQGIFAIGFFDTFDVILYMAGITAGYALFRRFPFEVMGTRYDQKLVAAIKELFLEIRGMRQR